MVFNLFGQSTDSLNVEELYGLAKTNADTKPKTAKKYLYQTVAYIDSVLNEKEDLPLYFKKKKAQSLHFLSYFERRENNFDIALRHMHHSIKLKEDIEEFESLAISYHQLAQLWMYQFEFDKAELHLDSAYRLTKKYENPVERLRIISTYGNLYYNKKDTARAETSHLKALKLVDSLNNPYDIAAINANYALFLRQMLRYEENVPYLEKSIEYHRKNNNKIGLESALSALAVTYRNLNQPHVALQYANASIKLSEELNNNALIPFRYNTLANVYRDLGEHKKALDAYIKYRHLLDDRRDIETYKKMADLDAKFKYKKQQALDSLRFVQEKELATAALQQKNERRTLWMTIVFLIVLAMAVIGYLLFRQRALRAERDVQDKLIKNMALRDQVAAKSEQVDKLITETVSRINKKQQLTAEIQKALSSDDQTLFKGILAELKADKIEDSKSKLFKEQLGHINLEFAQKLKKEFPELTKTELDIASYIQLGMSRNDIANLRNTSFVAVKKTINRLRKKLPLDQKQTLNDFFTKV